MSRRETNLEKLIRASDRSKRETNLEKLIRAAARVLEEAAPRNVIGPSPLLDAIYFLAEALREAKNGSCPPVPEPIWEPGIVHKLAMARAALESIANGEGADEQAFDWPEFYASVRRQAREAFEQTVRAFAIGRRPEEEGVSMDEVDKTTLRELAMDLERVAHRILGRCGEDSDQILLGGFHIDLDEAEELIVRLRMRARGLRG